jgi:hypothetical protein
MSFKIGDIIGYSNSDNSICYLVVDVSKRTGYPTVLKTIGFYSKGKIKHLKEEGDIHHTTDPNGWELDWKIITEMTQIEIISNKVKRMYERRKEQGYAF